MRVQAKSDSAASQPSHRPTVVVQGLGFVGAAMALAVARARTAGGSPAYDVIGVDLPTPRGCAAAESLNAGRFPFGTVDDRLAEAATAARETGNLVATTDERAYDAAHVVVVDVDLDLASDFDETPRVAFDRFENAIETVGRHIAPGCLVMVETTVPPGTCERIVHPILARCFEARGVDPTKVLLAHSFERVMPGAEYLDSIVNFWRVYAGHDETAADRCAAFLSSVVNVVEYPLTRVASTTASETAKLLENTYRAVNIALIDEWSRFAEAVGVDLFEVIAAIRMRPTHNNIRQPGFGVGGYCLTKDPLFAMAGAAQLFGREDLAFPLSRSGVEINRRMPLASAAQLRSMLGIGLAGRRLLLLGVSYRPEVDDTRYSPSQTFVEAMKREGADVTVHDPLVRHWAELDIDIPEQMPPANGFDAVIFAVSHREYREIDPARWLAGARPAILDANDVLSAAQREAFGAAGCRIECIGRGRAA